MIVSCNFFLDSEVALPPGKVGYRQQRISEREYRAAILLTSASSWVSQSRV